MTLKAASAETSDPIPKEIFRAYDIRGIVPSQLNQDRVYRIGQAIGSEALRQGINCLLTGRDGRLSSPSLAPALSAGILSTGCNTVDLGLVPTPLLYFASFESDWDSGVMLTASHNPKDYNGIKILFRRRSLSSQQISGLAERIIDQDFISGAGTQQSLDIKPRYLERIADSIKPAHPLKLVLDCANAVPAVVAGDLYRRLGCEVDVLNETVDGSFPSHHPDPTVAKNLRQLQQRVLETGADLGIAFDGDGDRLGIVSNEGSVIGTDRLLMLLVKSIAPDYPGEPIVFDVKCSSALAKLIAELGAEPVMHNSGHSLMKQKMLETEAPIGGEYSAHVFIKDRWYGFDDGLYTGARVIEILSQLPHSAEQEFATLTTPPGTPELSIPVPEADKFALMDRIIALADFDDGKCITLDGLRVEFDSGWGLIRASNTSPALLLRFEAENAAELEGIQARFKALVLRADNSLQIDF